MSAPIEGTLRAVVWPVYVGVATDDQTPSVTNVGEPHNGGYVRGTILWYPVGGEIRGRAEIHCPPGTYTHFCYFYHPTKPEAMGVIKMDHPVTFDRFTVLTVDPIINSDQQLAKARV